MAVVEILMSNTSKDDTIMHLLCSLHFFWAKHDIRISVIHIPGVYNTCTLADALSRDSALEGSGGESVWLALSILEDQAQEYPTNGITSNTVFARSDTAATVYFFAWVCAVFIRERRLLIPVVTNEAIRRETVDWRHWTRRFWPLCWCRRRLELVLGLYRYFSSICHRKWVERHVYVPCAPPIIGVVPWHSYYLRAATISFSTSGVAGIIRERWLIESGIWSSEYGTQKVYSVAQRAYSDFCSWMKFSPLPASEVTLLLFITELALTWAHTTIRTYVSGVRHLQILHGFANPLANTPRLDVVLNSMQQIKPRQLRRLPITPAVLLKIKSGLNKLYSSGRLRQNNAVGGMPISFLCLSTLQRVHNPSFQAYEPNKHQSVRDVAVDSHNSPTIMSTKIKSSKTDKFRQGVSLFICRGQSTLCPM